MVTAAAARVLRLPVAGRLGIGLPADLLVIPARRSESEAADALLATRRADITLVMRDGVPLIGAEGFRTLFTARRVATAPVRVDGVSRLAEARLAGRIGNASIPEPGVECA